MREALERLVEHLEKAKEAALEAKMDYHYLSEIDHLKSTAKANMNEGK